MKFKMTKIKSILSGMAAFLLPFAGSLFRYSDVYAVSGWHSGYTYAYAEADSFQYRTHNTTTGEFEAYFQWSSGYYTYGDQVKAVHVKDENGLRYYNLYGGQYMNQACINAGYVFGRDYHIIKDFTHNSKGQWVSGTQIGQVAATGVGALSQWGAPVTVALKPGTHVIWICCWNDVSWTASFCKFTINIPDYRQYSIQYDANKPSISSSNVTGTMASQTKIGTETAVALNKNQFALTGWTFQGWAKEAGASSVMFKDGETVKGLSDVNGAVVKLYAVWKQNSYTVKYNSNGGSGTMSSQSCLYDNQEPYIYSENKFTPPSKTGYTYQFQSWKTQEGAIVKPGMQYNNLTNANGATYNLYAQWLEIPNKYTVTYNPNKPSRASGSVTGTIYGTDVKGETLTNKDEFQYGIPKNLSNDVYTLKGWTIKGWTTKADGTGEMYSIGQPVQNLTTTNGANINLYAKWEPIHYNVEFNGNGSTSGSMTALNNLVYDGAKTSLPTNQYTRTGYTFVSWNTKPDGTGREFNYSDSAKNYIQNLTDVDGETIVLYAQWAPRTYTIQYNSNTGSGTMANQTVTYDTIATLSKNTFTKTGYVFEGWNTSKDGSGIGYTDQEKVTNLKTGESGNNTITLYARWRPIHYTVDYQANFDCLEKCEG